ncbi:MAG: hypothetical protein ACHQAY_01880 [Hyphomicrobiales bacterium]
MPHALAVRGHRGRLLERQVVIFRLFRQREQLHKDIEMEDQENGRGHNEESGERQFDVQERHLDRLFEEQIAMRDRSDGDRQIDLEGDEGRPENGSPAGRVVE